jgi:hypothetical protein
MYSSKILVGSDVDIQAKPKFLVKALGALDVRDRQHHNFKFQIHDHSTPFLCFGWLLSPELDG